MTTLLICSYVLLVAGTLSDIFSTLFVWSNDGRRGPKGTLHTKEANPVIGNGPHRTARMIAAKVIMLAVFAGISYYYWNIDETMAVLAGVGGGVLQLCVAAWNVSVYYRGLRMIGLR